MTGYHIGLFSTAKSQAYIIGYAFFRKSGQTTWSRIDVSGLCPSDTYQVFYILKNPLKRMSAAQVGQVSVSSQGRIVFEREFDNRIQNGHCNNEKEVIGVVLALPHDSSLTVPVVGGLDKEFKWKPLVEKYLQTQECKDSGISNNYCPNASYDNIIDSLPPSSVFEARDKIEKAVEISDLHKLDLDGFINGIDHYESALLIRIRTGDFKLYLLGLSGNADSRRQDYSDNHFELFLCNSTAKTPHDDASCGYWCKYL